MNPPKVNVHELIAWGLDDYPYRSSAIGPRQRELAMKVEQTRRRLTSRDSYVDCYALQREETVSIKHLLSAAAQRTDLEEEYEGLKWMLGVIDLRCLLAFQRRLIFSAEQDISAVPRQNDWPQLIALALGRQRDTEHRVVHNARTIESVAISLRSSNPDLRLRLKPNAPRGCSPLSLHGGSPFFEVAEFRGRWFLRDGYHRAYRLLQAGVYSVPAVVIHARTIEELGAVGPWFFKEEQLFSDHPPRVMDFLDESLTLRYQRIALRKVIRIHIEESLEPFNETDEV